MKFSLVAAPNLCTDCDVVYGEGPVTPGIAKAFRAFTDGKLTGRKLVVIFNSGGGSVEGSWELGRHLRGLKPETIAGAVVERPDGLAELRAGTCVSACNALLISGVERALVPGTTFGIHQFSSTAENFKNLDNQVTVQQMRIQLATTAKWLAYNREMGVDTALVEAQLAVPYEKVEFVAPEQLTVWKVTTKAGERLPKLLRDTPAPSPQAALPPVASVPNEAAPPVPAPSIRPADRQWATLKTTNNWTETFVESDADYTRVAIACAPNGRVAVTMGRRGTSEAKQREWMRVMLDNGGMNLMGKNVDMTQMSVVFGGYFSVRANLRPDQAERLAASNGMMMFAPGESDEATRLGTAFMTTGFETQVGRLIAECKPKA